MMLEGNEIMCILLQKINTSQNQRTRVITKENKRETSRAL